MDIKKYNPEKLTKDEMEVFSNELLDDFQMMETYAGGNNNGCVNDHCGVNINFFCGEDCVFKAWFNCLGKTDTDK